MPSTHLRAVIFGTLAIAFAGCQKAEFDKATPDAVVLALSDDSLTADDGAITVTAQALEDGVPLTDRDLRISITGVNPQGEQILTSDAATGYVTVDFTNLRVAGVSTVTVSVGNPPNEIDESLPFTVTPGAPASLAFQVLDSMPIEAGDVPAYTSDVFDAWNNQIPSPPILLTTTSDEATIVTGGLIEFRRVGTWDVHAYMEGTTLDEVVQVEVEATDAAQVTTQIDRTLADPADTVRIQCNEYDVFSNDRTENGTFTAGTEAFTTPPSTIAAVAGTAGLFTASGFPSNGAYLAACQNGALNDTKAFSVVPASGVNSVLATVSQNLVDAGLTITVNCKQKDSFGAILPTPAGGFNFTIPTNPSGATHDSGAGDTGGPGDGIDFVIGGGMSLDALGSHLAQCAVGALTDTEDFAVIDLTAPVVNAANITAATGPNGLEPDHYYGNGTTLTVSANATDFIGVRFVAILTTSGSATATDADAFGAGTTNANASVVGTINPFASAPTFSTVQFRIRAEDAAGNFSELPVTQLVTVDGAVSIGVPAGVTMRTLYESPLDLNRITTALSTDGTDLFVQRSTIATGDIFDVVRITGDTGPAAASTFLSMGLPTADPSGGAVATAAAFGGRNYFQTFDDPAVTIGSANAGTHVLFAGTNGAMNPGDLTFGNPGPTGNNLFFDDEGGAIFRADSAGTIFPYTGVVSSGLVLAFDGATLLAVSQGGDYFRVIDDGTGNGIVNPIASLGPALGLPTIGDLAMNGTQLLLTDGGGLVTRVNAMASTRNDITGGLIDVNGLAVKTGGNLYILAEPSGGFHRIYKVTGY